MTSCTGLLLDFGGVLTTSVTESFSRFCEDEGIDTGVFRKVILDHAQAPESVFSSVETGAIEQEEFDHLLAGIISGATGKQIEPSGLKQRLFAASTPDERMLDAVRTARTQGVRTALVSNSWGGNDYPRELFGELFDGVVISGEVGLRKPDPEIYRLAASTIGIEPGLCAFVDDFKINVLGAEAVGMTGIHHRNAGETIARIEQLFGVDLSSREAR